MRANTYPYPLSGDLIAILNKALLPQREPIGQCPGGCGSGWCGRPGTYTVCGFSTSSIQCDVMRAAEGRIDVE